MIGSKSPPNPGDAAGDMAWRADFLEFPNGPSTAKVFGVTVCGGTSRRNGFATTSALGRLTNREIDGAAMKWQFDSHGRVDAMDPEARNPSVGPICRWRSRP